MKLSILVVLCLSITGIYAYTAVGNKIKDPTGALVTIRGVDRPSFEWNANGEQASLSDYTLMRAWGANVVRIATNQQFWMSSTAYALVMDQQIEWANKVGMGVILDLHWNDNNGQQNMADSRSITFWSQVAARYKNNAWVMFELYNEPHDVSWSTWLSGDSTYAGMQQLYNAVRAAGANNLCIVGGLNWAFDLSGVSSGYAVVGTNIAYATHPYDFAGKQLADWPAAFGNLASTYPVIMTEFGQYCASNTYVSDLLTYAESLGIHYTAWAWYVSDCSFPSIIADWNGTPTPGVGELVKRYLSGKGSTVAPTQAPTSSGSSSNSGSSGSSGTSSQASSAMVLYTDSLASGWQDWSWSTSYSIADTTYAHTGSKSIKFELVSYQGVYYRYTSSITIGLYSQIVFYVNGGTSTKAAGLVVVKIYGTAGTQIGNAVPLTAAATANQWTQIAIPITSFAVDSASLIVGVVIQSAVSDSAGFVWIDDISMVPSSSGVPTSAPTAAPTAAPTNKPTLAPTLAPTSAPTTAPTAAPTTKPTLAPTLAPTTAPTSAPTAAPTTKPTSAPTSTPTAKPTTVPTAAPTSRPTSTLTSPQGDSCGPSSVYFVQTVAGSWQIGAQTVTQYTLEIHNTCSSKKLVGLTMTPSNWNTVNFWNIVSSDSTLSLPPYASVSSSTPFVVGYQSVAGQASFTVKTATFQ